LPKQVGASSGTAFGGTLAILASFPSHLAFREYVLADIGQQLLTEHGFLRPNPTHSIHS
jgi:hypothetical protein